MRTQPNQAYSPGHDISPKGNVIWRPTKDEVENLQLGSLALDCFGNWNPIATIHARGLDDKGNPYCCYYTWWHGDGKISGAVTAGEIVITVPLTAEYHRTESIP